MLPTTVCCHALIVLIVIALCDVRYLNAEQIQHPDDKHIFVNGAKLWVEMEGKGNPILLIPGGPGVSHTPFHPYFSALADQYQVIYFDAFGRGKSDRAESSEEYRFERDVADVEELRKTLGIKSRHILGSSYGTLVAQEYALRYPTSVDRLILMSISFGSIRTALTQLGYDWEIANPTT